MDRTERFNPFPGLRPFEPEEDHLFFGRQRDVDALLKRLGDSRLLAVLGGSGSGKSSLVRSGVIPCLYSGYMVRAGSSWRVALMRPGGAPLGNLADVLSTPHLLGRTGEPAAVGRMLIETTLRRSNLGLADCIRQARLPLGENVLLVVDQFEELFRFRRSGDAHNAGDEAVAFVKRLLHAVRQEDVPLYVMLTMRSDFIGECTDYPGLPEAINAGQYLVPRMDRQQLREAITGPVAVGGAQITPRLVVHLLNELGDEPDQLPVLQHALMRTWARWQQEAAPGEPLDLRHYEAIGTMREALSRHAEEAYAELGTERAQLIGERLFKALVDTSSDARGVRRPATIAELCDLTEATQDELATVIECFRQPGRSFLMPASEVPLLPQTVVDLSHESLMRLWRRLITWARQEKESAESYVLIAQAAERWEEGSAGLWRDPELQLGLQWRTRSKPIAAWARRYRPGFDRAMRFLDQSLEARDRERAERTRRRRNRLRTAWGVAVVLLVFALYALFQKDRAQQAQQLAEHNLQLAKRAVDSLLTAVGKESLAEVPQMEEIRQGLLEQAKGFYDLFLHQQPTEPALRLEAGLAQVRLGDIHRLRGQNAEAEARYRQAIAQLDALHRDHADQPRYLFELAQAYNSYGEQLRPYDSARAGDAYGRALSLYQDLLERFAPAPEYRLGNALVLNNYGILLSADAETQAEAEARYRRAIEQLEGLHGGERANPRVALRLAQTYNNLGSLLRADPGREALAQEMYRKAIEVMQGVPEAEATRREYREEQAKFYNNLANLLLSEGALAPSLQANGQSLDLFEALAAPVRGLRNELANSYNSRGSILLQLGRTQRDPAGEQELRAEEAFERAIQIFESLKRDFEDFQEDPDLNARYANALANLGGLRMESRDFEDAARLLSLAVSHYSVALKSAAPDSQYFQNLASIYWLLSQTHLRSGDHRAAADAAAALARNWADKENLYRAAKVLARCIELARSDKKLSAEQRAKVAGSYASSATKLVSDALDGGLSRERVENDARSSGALYPLREYQDFRKLLASGNGN